MVALLLAGDWSLADLSLLTLMLAMMLLKSSLTPEFIFADVSQ